MCGGGGGGAVPFEFGLKSGGRGKEEVAGGRGREELLPTLGTLGRTAPPRN